MFNFNYFAAKQQEDIERIKIGVRIICALQVLPCLMEGPEKVTIKLRSQALSGRGNPSEKKPHNYK